MRLITKFTCWVGILLVITLLVADNIIPIVSLILALVISPLIALSVLEKHNRGKEIEVQ